MIQTKNTKAKTAPIPPAIPPTLICLLSGSADGLALAAVSPRPDTVLLNGVTTGFDPQVTPVIVGASRVVEAVRDAIEEMLVVDSRLFRTDVELDVVSASSVDDVVA